MTALMCEPLEWRATNVCHRAELDPRALAVEEIVQLRHDIDDHALALTLLRGVRPDLPVLALEAKVLDLIDASRAVVDDERYGRAAHEAAMERYELALHELACGGAS